MTAGRGVIPALDDRHREGRTPSSCPWPVCSLPRNSEDEIVLDRIGFPRRNPSETLDALEVDSEFITRGGIFSRELLDQWKKLKQQEIKSIGTMPHPFEYKKYFNL